MFVSRFYIHSLKINKMFHLLDDTIPTTHPASPTSATEASHAAATTATGNTENGVQENTIPSPMRREVRPVKPRHPYEVLRSLPPDATPAQQDSAIQAVFQPEVIERSTQPDTLHLPGHTPGKSFKEINLPQYYRESFFAKDSLFHPELNGGRYGVAGDPVPYTMRNDNVITGLLLGCFVVALFSLAHARGFLFRQAKNFFYVSKSGPKSVTETTSEIRLQFFLVGLTCLLFSILCFFFSREYIAETLILSSQHQLIAICFAIMVVYFLLKGLLYWSVNWIFFDRKKNEQWMKSQLFIFAMEGLALFPLVLLQVYFNLSMQSAMIYALIVIILVKILSFYKCYLIFFKGISVVLQIFLYFCALEIIPLLSLGGILALIGNYLKINY